MKKSTSQKRKSQPSETPHKVARVHTSYAQKLRRDGVAVVPALTLEEVEGFNSFLRTVEWPEFVTGVARPFVLGGFGAYGHPSSFHHDAVRNMRRAIKTRLADAVFREFAPGKNLESLFDRLCERKASYGTVSRESWHQDVFVNPAFPDDLVFGGWVNLDTADDQRFFCVKGTQHERLTTSGFAKVTDKTKLELYEASECIKRVPPGHAILIQQGLIHRVNPQLKSEASFRLFHGFRITRDTQPMFPETFEVVVPSLGVPRLPSGQITPMYSPNHLMYPKLRPKLAEICSKLRPEFCSDHVFENGASKGEVVRVPGVDRVLPPLAPILGQIYTYSEKDRRVLTPEPL